MAVKGENPRHPETFGNSNNRCVHKSDTAVRVSVHELVASNQIKRTDRFELKFTGDHALKNRECCPVSDAGAYEMFYLWEHGCRDKEGFGRTTKRTSNNLMIAVSSVDERK